MVVHRVVVQRLVRVVFAMGRSSATHCMTWRCDRAWCFRVYVSMCCSTLHGFTGSDHCFAHRSGARLSQTDSSSFSRRTRHRRSTAAASLDREGHGRDECSADRAATASARTRTRPRHHHLHPPRTSLPRQHHLPWGSAGGTTGRSAAIVAINQMGRCSMHTATHAVMPCMAALPSFHPLLSHCLVLTPSGAQTHDVA